MGLIVIENKLGDIIDNYVEPEKSFYEFQDHVIPISSIITKKIAEDIYSGNEDIAFTDRHPIYKSLIKLEFEEAIFSYIDSQKS